MPMFRVKFNCPTTISCEVDFEAENLDDAYATVEDKIVAIEESHAKAMVAFRKLDWKERVALKEPEDPLHWDGGDAVDNADTTAIDVDEITEL